MKAKQTERTDRRGVALAMGAFESLGFAFREQSESDYGIDCHAERIDSEQPTGQLLGIQLKTGSSYLSERTETAIVFRTDVEHVEYWLNHSLPVIVCLCDPEDQIIYWQVINKETAISTGKGYKFDVPLSQILDDAAVRQLNDLLTPLVPTDRFTIFRTEDKSHGKAKRYSFKIVINGSVSKAEMASVVRQVTIDGTKRRYHRNHMVEGRWGDADAHIVWTFLYLSAEDEARGNHVCRSQWVNESLNESARPPTIVGENIGNDITVEWNFDYSFLANHMSTNTLTKEVYLNEVIPMIEELKQLLHSVGGSLLELETGSISEDLFLDITDVARKRINDIHTVVSDMSLAPFECKDMDQKFDSVVVSMDNMALAFSAEERKTRTPGNRLKMALQQRSYAIADLCDLEYEVKKIR